MSPPTSSSGMSSGHAPASSSPDADVASGESDGGSARPAVGGGNMTIVFRRPALKRMESTEEEEEEDFLCTFICDLLAGLRRSPEQCWDQGICQRVSAALKKCHLHDGDILDDNDSDAEEVVTVDLRGRYARDAKRDLMIHLFCCSRMPDVKYLKVIVGCKVHGVGKGILRRTIIGLIESDDTIAWKRENGGSVIAINIDYEKDYRSLDWKEAVSIDKEQWDEALSQVVVKTEGAVAPEEEDFLCTFICDFLSGIPKSGTIFWDANMCKRIAAGVSRCDRAEQDRQRKFQDSMNIVEDAMTIGIEGQYIEDALPLIKRHLYGLSCMCSPVSAMRFLNIQVGCKIHGVGKGKLKQAVIDMLEMEDDLKWREEHRGAVISIELDGRNFFNFLGEDFDPLRPRFGDCFDLLLDLGAT